MISCNIKWRFDAQRDPMQQFRADNSPPIFKILQQQQQLLLIFIKVRIWTCCTASKDQKLKRRRCWFVELLRHLIMNYDGPVKCPIVKHLTPRPILLERYSGGSRRYHYDVDWNLSTWSHVSPTTTSSIKIQKNSIDISQALIPEHGGNICEHRNFIWFTQSLAAASFFALWSTVWCHHETLNFPRIFLSFLLWNTIRPAI